MTFFAKRFVIARLDNSPYYRMYWTGGERGWGSDELCEALKFTTRKQARETMRRIGGGVIVETF